MGAVKGASKCSSGALSGAATAARSACGVSRSSSLRGGMRASKGKQPEEVML